ncbi:MAG: sodium:solute symporter family protein, partial [Bdellovibrionales bacterium]|nr:sodium:solute symporter family protein [Bdellovibrionales bacterium]
AYFAHKQSVHSLSDFFITNRTVPCMLLVGTILATTINTLAVTGVPALVYKGGILYAQMWVIGIIAPLLIALFGTKIWRYGKEHGVMTQGEMFAKYYHSRPLMFLTPFIGLLAIFPFMAIQLSAIGKVFSAATSGVINYEVAVIISACSIGMYLYLGGARAVVWTDVVQALCFLIIIIASAILFTSWSGGYVAGLSRLQEVIPQKLSFNEQNTPIFIDNILSWPFAFFLWPQLFQRMFMAKSEKAIRQSIPWNFILFNLVVLCTMTMGIMATGTLYGKISDPDQLVAMMYQEFLPLGGAMIVIAVFATGMSTVDSILLTASSIFHRDILQHTSTKLLHGKDEYQVARLTALGFLVVVTLFALSPNGRGAMAPLVTLGASFATLFLWPLVGMFYMQAVSSRTVFVTMCSGAIAILATKFTVLSEWLPFGSGTAGFLCGLIVFLCGALVIDRFSKKEMKNPELCSI